MIVVAPSILAADFANLERDIKKIEAAGADWVHVDAMDGTFVPNLTIGAPVVKYIKPITKLFVDVHLMICNPEKHIPDYVAAGADLITFHMEAYRFAHDGSGTYECLIPNSVYQRVLGKKASGDEPFTDILEAWEASGTTANCFDIESIKTTIKLIKSSGKKAGVSINPSTPVTILDSVVADLDLVLLMSVNPGFGGQKFKAHIVDKIKELKKLKNYHPDLIIEVDGGVTVGKIANDLKQAGATALVAGTAVYGAEDIKQAISELKA